MDWDKPLFVILIIALVVGGKLAKAWIRARHGYPLVDDEGRVTGPEMPDAARRIHLLATENGRMADQITRLEDRVAVLERIATDRSRRLADEIDALR